MSTVTWDPAAMVGFHDAECGNYRADLPVWRALAETAGGPVLDIGAGTGRVSLDLAAHGFDVTALDVDDVLLAALRDRAADRNLRVPTVVADAQALEPTGPLAPYRPPGVGFAPTPAGGGAFALVLVPMQTVQLLPDRPALLRGIRGLLAPGGLAALAIADDLVAFDGGDGALPTPDLAELDGRRYESQPLAVRVGPDRARIERLRTIVEPGGERVSGPDLIELHRLDVATLHAEAAAAGLEPGTGARIGQTDEHVGSAVVVVHG